MAATGGAGLPGGSLAPGRAPAPGRPARGPARGAGKPAAATPSRPTLNPLLNPDQVLGGPSLLQAAQSLANTQTQPAIQQLQQLIAQQQRQTQGAENLTGGYFNQLMGQAQGAAGQVAQQGAGLSTQLGQIAADENAQLRGLGQGAQNMLAKYSPEAASGAGMSGLAQEIARQQGLAAQSEGSQRAFGALQGANYSGLAGSQVETGALKGIEDLNQIAQAGQIKNAPLTQKIAQLQAERGALTAADLGKLRQQEITNAITEKGLGIRQQDLQLQRQLQQFNTNPNAPGSPANARVQGAQTAQQRANNAAKNQNFQNNPNAVGSAAWQRVQSLQGRQWSSNPNAVGSPAWARVQTAQRAQGGAAGGGKPLTTNENNAWFRTLGQVQQFIQDGQQHGETAAQIKASLQGGNNVAKRSFDPVMVEAAYELLGWGHITPQTAAALHNMGVRGGTFRGKPIQVAPPPQSAPTGFGPSSSNPFQNVGQQVAGAVSGLGG